MKRRALAFTVPFASLILLAVSCRDATQVTLDIRYGDPCARLKSVGIIATTDPLAAEKRAAGAEYTTVTTSCTDVPGLTSRVGTISVSPGDGRTRAAITIVAGVDTPADRCRPDNQFKGCIVARRSFAFLAHAGPTFPIRLEPECKDVPCDAQTTCKKGKCVDAAAECNDDECVDVVPVRPGGDGGGPDGSQDASNDRDDDAAFEDSPADSPVTDADADSPTLCPPGPNAPRVCPPYEDPGASCTLNCVLSSAGAMCTAATGLFNAGCTASRQCGASEGCCWGGASNFAVCAAGPCAGAILCRSNCDCVTQPATSCRDNRPGSPPFVKFCW